VIEIISIREEEEERREIDLSRLSVQPITMDVNKFYLLIGMKGQIAVYNAETLVHQAYLASSSTETVLVHAPKFSCSDSTLVAIGHDEVLNIWTLINLVYHFPANDPAEEQMSHIVGIKD
jgi:hypothetical protein